MASMQHRLPSPEPVPCAAPTPATGAAGGPGNPMTAATRPEDAEDARRHFARALDLAPNLDSLAAPRPGDDRR